MANNCDDEQQLSLEGILPSKVNRSFLHSNSTSHTWPFSAIAELIDNAYDPGVDAKCLKIDVEDVSGIRCLSFTDDGSGMTPKQLHKMLSFGFCEKDIVGEGGQKKARTLGSSRNHIPLGQYGNGFKSGSMRLGRDVIVFTKSSSSSSSSSSSDDDRTMSVGLLSQTFLEAIEAETVLVPIVTWKQTTKELRQSAKNRSLEHILNHSSLFTSEDELLLQFDNIEGSSGTRIIIYNLKQGSDTLYELDLDSDEMDILNPETTEADEYGGSDGAREVREHSLCRKSLREYCSTLFLYSRMTIVLRGKEVKSKRPYESLRNKTTETYKPKNQGKSIKMTFGRWNEDRKITVGDYGVLFYYKNRLIKAYEKVGCQKKGKGVNIVGIVEIPPDIDGIVPIHNKQDFLESNRFSTLMRELGKKLNIYANEVTPVNRCEIKEEPKRLIVRLSHRPKNSRQQSSTSASRRSLSVSDPCVSPDSLASSPSPSAIPSASHSASPREHIAAPGFPSAPAPASVSVSATAPDPATASGPVCVPVSVPISAIVTAPVPATVSISTLAPASVSISASDPAVVSVPLSAAVPLSAIVTDHISAPPYVLPGLEDLSYLVPAFPDADPDLLVLQSGLSRLASDAASAVFPSTLPYQPLDEPPIVPNSDRADARRSSNAVVGENINTLSQLHLQIELLASNSVATCRENTAAMEFPKTEDEFSVCEAGTAAAATDSRRSVESRSVQTEARHTADAMVEAVDLQAPMGEDSVVEKKLIQLRLKVLKFLRSLDPNFRYESLEEIDRKFEDFLQVNSQALQPIDEDNAPSHHGNHHQQQQQRRHRTKLRQSKRAEDVADSSTEAKKASCTITRWILKKERSPPPVVILDSDDDDKPDVSNCASHLQRAPDVVEAPAGADVTTAPASATITTPTDQQSPADQQEVDQGESTWKIRLGRRHNTSKETEESAVQVKQLRKN